MPSERDRVTVSTYVTADQHERWREDAEDLGMSQSEFVRTMVQAGRRGFSLAYSPENPQETDVAGSNPGGNGLKTALLEVLRETGPLAWPELTEALIGDLEDDLESALVELQAENRVHHSPREGTYSLAEAASGD